jgi:3,4-dihydroxy 2-butanone 4-phosphate synthase/GTP cyclohydrolase II
MVARGPMNTSECNNTSYSSSPSIEVAASASTTNSNSIENNSNNRNSNNMNDCREHNRNDIKQTMGLLKLRNHQLLFLASLLFLSYSEAFAATTSSPLKSYFLNIQRGGSLSSSTQLAGELSDSEDSLPPKKKSSRISKIAYSKGFGTTLHTAMNSNGSTNGQYPQPENDGVQCAPENEQILPCRYIAETNLPTDVGQFRLRAYRVDDIDHRTFVKNKFVGSEPCVIYNPDKSPFEGSVNGSTINGASTLNLKKNVPVRIHDQCFTSEVFRSQRCDCKEQLKMSLEYIQEHGGAVIYLQQEGRGIGLANKVAAYALQDDGMDTVDANTHLGFPEDARQYGCVPSILKDMGIDSIKLITNNPRKIERLTSLGVNVADTIPMVVERASVYNRKYLQTKQDRMNHNNFGAMLQLDNFGDDRSLDMLVNEAVTNLRRSGEPIAQEYINEGEEMAAAAITAALVDDENFDSQAGVTAADDGYCFGRKSVEDAVAAVARGEIVVVVDDMDRENEGDFIMAADLATPETLATIIRYSSGVICIGMEGERMDELKLPAMLKNNEDPKETAFSVTVDATKEHGITTGISATDRAVTMRLLAKSSTNHLDFARPGHIFPLRAKEGGVLTRDGHTEAAVDLSRLAGRHPSGVLCEIVSEENPVEMARLPELKRFCKKHGFVLTSIVDIAQYRRDTEDLNQ